jgi:formylglycine-generating enzyme required for sulfatase activity
MNQPAIEIFFSYARKDELLRDELNKHLKPLQQEGIITAWHDREIPPGAEWQNEIDRHLESAQIILLLISADFLASDYCYSFELKRALERHASNEARVIPVILRSCDWQNTPFGKLQVLPTDGKPIQSKSWFDPDEAFTDVVRGLRRSIDQLTLIPVETSTSIPPNSQVVTTPVQPDSEPQERNKPSLKPFPFETVRLNERGQIIERPSITVNRFMENLGKGVRLAMVEIPAGKFLMGSPSSEEDNLEREKPQHWVEIPRFYLGQSLITQGQWKALMKGKNPAYFKGDDNLPVEQVSWLESIEFCQKLSAKTGRAYRLPSEAEWEYACRAGSEKPFAFGKTINSEVVNYNGNYPYGKGSNGNYLKKTTPAGKFPANSFGLYDMHGNLWEWCLDEWVNNYSDAPVGGSARGDVNTRDSDKPRLTRGGSWVNDATDCRSAIRFCNSATYGLSNVGLRVVAVPASTPSRQTIQGSKESTLGVQHFIPMT